MGVRGGVRRNGSGASGHEKLLDIYVIAYVATHVRLLMHYFAADTPYSCDLRSRPTYVWTKATSGTTFTSRWWITSKMRTKATIGRNCLTGGSCKCVVPLLLLLKSSQTSRYYR